MRIIIDTNNLVSALIESRGPSAQLIDAWLDDAFDLVTSAAQLTEMRGVLCRPRVRTRINANEAGLLLDLLEREAVLVDPAVGVEISADPDDNTIIATAIAGRADVIVSGDRRHLLSLGEAAGVPIRTARQTLERLNDSFPA